MFGSRSRASRKSSPEPTAEAASSAHNHNNQDSGLIDPSTPQGRRRTKKKSVVSSPVVVRRTALPLYHQPPGSSTCNTFLMGGHYYPGKDKKGRHKRTIWYRVFCSSSWRVALSSIVFSYVFVWCILVPSLSTVLSYGKMLAPGQAATATSTTQKGNTNVLADLNLPPIEQERKGFQKLQLLRERFRATSRQKILKEIVPDWYHRNDQPRIKDNAVHDNKQIHTTTDDTIRHKSQKKAKPPRVDKKNMEERRHEDSPKRKPKPVEDDPIITQADIQKSDEVKKPTVIKEESSKKDKRHDANEDGSRSDEKAIVNEQVKGIINEGKGQLDATEKTHAKLPSGSTNDGSVMKRTLHNMEDHHKLSLCPASITTMNTTLLTQCSLDRLWILHETCKRWKDPIVVVVHLTASDKVDFDQYTSACPHITVISYIADKNEREWHYPVNRLRNLGLDAVKTSHVMVADIDFVPSQDLDLNIRRVLDDRQRQRAVTSVVAAEDRDAIVVPAFERVEDCSSQDCSQLLKANSSFIPSTKDELQRCISNKLCIVFQSQNNWEGHHSTNSEQWLQGDYYEEESVTLADESKSKIIKRVACFDSLRYEPYVVIRWCPTTSSTSSPSKPVAPYYDERFYGYGKNKIQLVSHLRFLGYQFSILPDGFIVHNPHFESQAKKVWNDVADYKLHEQMDKLYPAFLKELINKYTGVTDPRSIVQQCDRGKKKMVKR